eukprot:6195546-Pleurochrysis_carterae.AAC.3
MKKVVQLRLQIKSQRREAGRGSRRKQFSWQQGLRKRQGCESGKDLGKARGESTTGLSPGCSAYGHPSLTYTRPASSAGLLLLFFSD